jgi:hypothetical protein
MSGLSDDGERFFLTKMAGAWSLTVSGGRWILYMIRWF